MEITAEHQRLEAYRKRRANWKKWGPYLSERSWGTVREDYSADGSAWDYFPHDHARSRAYRWGEDGIAGISDRHQYICLALSLWNGRDPILKERMFGLNGAEGNHGEDVKEYYFYLDSTPTHSYMKMLYKYPQAGYPYADLVSENRRRGFKDFEYELLDTGVFDGDRYFDVVIEYAKAGPDDILAGITLINRGPDTAGCAALPCLWFRNTWSWGYETGPMNDVAGRPHLKQIKAPDVLSAVKIQHPAAGGYFWYIENADDLLFTDNETNAARFGNTPNAHPFVKDAFHRYLVDGETDAVNPAKEGTKVAALFDVDIDPGQLRTFRLRLARTGHEKPFAEFDAILAARQTEADEFYDSIQNPDLSANERDVQRQALAGLLWTKQFYYYNVEQWLQGDPGRPAPPASRRHGRNRKWAHLNNFDIISMPDKWEYPWFAAWDLAFHCIPLALVDADFAKRQLDLMAREWYMHPNGALPAYEWQFGDVNPPVHAWAAWRVYKIDAKQQGAADRSFLEGIFHKLLLNFTCWVNRKDMDGNNVFQGGFLGLDNISVFDRSAPLPTGGHIDQSDGTSWMGFYCLVMLKIALELARDNPVYQDTASKFFEHFLRIARAMTDECHGGKSLWDESDGFFYDVLHLPGGGYARLKVRSLVGLMPLLVVETLEPDLVNRMPDFKRRLNWFFENRLYLRDSGDVACVKAQGEHARRLLSVVNRERLIRTLKPMLDENEFLSPFGIRSISKFHQARPYHFHVNGRTHTISYQPAESESGLFGGNSNWRGPVWFPINYLLIESLQKYDHYYGDTLKVECPTGSGNMMTLGEVATELSRRLIRLFLPNGDGGRPIYGGQRMFQNNPHWCDHMLFYEYFHGDNGAGLGASHQTGWTGLVAKLIQQSGGWENKER
ncbi:MGH1-like glycoside hydrolase domain-containing protein [Desulfobacter latus]|uniref:Glucosidase n=1 Tax=Desulfobacter latus TaxID=2292 RepID=A0A850SVK7_9BACT|nr:glucosidase [Desulfobacter latus]NWH05189.1 glucosidase [Desulfobacter latus]